MVSVEAIISRQSLRWSGHLVRMDDTRILKQLFYGELRLRKLKRSKPTQRYKDTVKANLKKCDIPVENWEELASDRSKWRKAIKDGVNEFERCKIQHASYKISIWKKELAVAPKELKGSMQCELYGRIRLSQAGFKSYMRSHKETPASWLEVYQVWQDCKVESWHEESPQKSCQERRRISRRQSKTSYSRTS